MSSRFSPLVLEEIPGLERFKAVFLIFLLAALPALVFSAYAYIIGKYRFWSGKSLFFYILEVAFGISLQFITRYRIRPRLNIYGHNSEFTIYI